MDSTQLLLSVVLTVTTILLVVIGIQLIFVLKELQKTMKKVNSIIDNFEKVGISLENSFSEITGFTSGIKTIFKVVDFFHAKKNSRSKS